MEKFDAAQEEKAGLREAKPPKKKRREVMAGIAAVVRKTGGKVQDG
jgi:hypothetical protein